MPVIVAAHFKFRIVLSYILLALFWGGSFVAIKIVVNGMEPFRGAAFRMGFAVLFFGILLRAQNRSLKLSSALKRQVWITGLFTIGIPFSFLFWGERFVAAGLAGIINGLVPIIITTILFSWLKKDNSQKASWQLFAGIILGFLGVLIVFYPKIVFKGELMEILGISAIVLMSVCYAIGNILNSRLLRGQKQLSLFTSVYHQQLISFFYLALLSLLFEPWPDLNTLFADKSVWMALVYLGIISTTLANLIYFYMIREAGAIITATVTYWIPIVALTLDYFFFGTKPSIWSITAVACILSGLILISLAPKKPKEIEIASAKAAN